MYQPLHPHIPTPPTKKLKLLATVAFTGFALLVLGVIIVCLNLITQYRISSDRQSQINSLTTSVNEISDQLVKAKRGLIVNDLLPDPVSFSAQCPGGNSKDGLFTPLSPTPIESYNVFLVDCRSNISTGKSLPRIVIFHVNNDGSKELTYGSTASEPLCVSNKIPVANAIAQNLALPICQTN